jgi:hypothetical protein
MLLQERSKTESEIYKAMMEIDQIAMRGPMKVSREEIAKANKFEQVEIINESSLSNKSLKVTHDTLIAEADTIYKTPTKPVLNTYPIKPMNNLGVGYGFDVHV